MSTATKDRSSARRVLQLIFLLQGHVLEGMRLQAVADALKTSAPTAYRDLEMLADEGVAERIPGRQEFWRLTPKIVQIARATGEEFARHRSRLDEFEQRYSRDPR